MKLTLAKTIEIDPNELRVVRGNMKDADSVNIACFYRDNLIATGHLNIVTNFAHVAMQFDNPTVEDYLVDAIENRTINFK